MHHAEDRARGGETDGAHLHERATELGEELLASGADLAQLDRHLREAGLVAEGLEGALHLGDWAR
jgi:hypothetical protein